MKIPIVKLVLTLFVLTLIAGCHISNYAIITDDRGDYSGVIRTGHKAYIIPTAQYVGIWSDGSDELFTMVYQNQYGDQRLYTFNNFDPTATVKFLDQTYCDWQYEGCAAFVSWNPVQNDEIFDYEYFDSCPGARSDCLFASVDYRLGECGDALFRRDLQGLFREFSLLEETTWRGERAYVLPINASNAAITLVASDGTRWAAPLYGDTTALVTDRLQIAMPMTPNTRHTIQWAHQWAAEHGQRATAELHYGGVSADIQISLRPEGLAYNSERF